MEEPKSLSSVEEFQEGINSAMIVLGLAKRICNESDIPTTGSNLALASQLLMVFCGIKNLKEVSIDAEDNGNGSETKIVL